MEVVVRLGRAGIAAERLRSSSSEDGNPLYSVFVDEVDYGRSMEILYEYALPGRASGGIEELTKPRTFLPNSLQIENLRLNHVLALEVERLVSAMPGVVSVSAVVRLPAYGTDSFAALLPVASRTALGREVDSAASNGAESAGGAAVVVRYVPSISGRVPFAVPELKSMVGRLLPELKPADIEIVASRVSLKGKSSFVGINSEDSGVLPLEFLLPFHFQVPEREKGTAQLQIFLSALVLLLVGLFMGIFICWTFKRGGRRSLPSKRRRGPLARGGNISAPSADVVESK